MLVTPAGVNTFTFKQSSPIPPLVYVPLARVLPAPGLTEGRSDQSFAVRGEEGGDVRLHTCQSVLGCIHTLGIGRVRGIVHQFRSTESIGRSERNPKVTRDIERFIRVPDHRNRKVVGDGEGNDRGGDVPVGGRGSGVGRPV